MFRDWRSFSRCVNETTKSYRMKLFARKISWLWPDSDRHQLLTNTYARPHTQYTAPKDIFIASGYFVSLRKKRKSRRITACKCRRLMINKPGQFDKHILMARYDGQRKKKDHRRQLELFLLILLILATNL